MEFCTGPVQRMAGVMALIVCGQVPVAQTIAPAPNMPVVPAHVGVRTRIFLFVDNSIGYRFGSEFMEPAIRNPSKSTGTPIQQNIVMLTPRGDAATS